MNWTFIGAVLGAIALAEVPFAYQRPRVYLTLMNPVALIFVGLAILALAFGAGVSSASSAVIDAYLDLKLSIPNLLEVMQAAANKEFNAAQTAQIVFIGASFLTRLVGVIASISAEDAMPKKQ